MCWKVVSGWAWKLRTGLVTGLVPLLILVWVCGFSSAAGWRHPISIVDADIYVTRFRTVMRLECYAEDLELLQGVSPLENGLYDPEEIAEATQDHARYLAERIVLRNADGDVIPAKISEIVDVEIPEDGIKAGTLMQYRMGFVLEYEYSQPPGFITVEQNMVAEGALLPSELKIVLKQTGLDAPYVHMMKPGQPQTFRFDWTIKALPEQASEAEQKKWFDEWFAEQRQKTLGIESYSSVYSFVYINKLEVRHEILVPLATLSNMMELEREEESFLSIPEQEKATEKIQAFFTAVNPVSIDGVRVQPVVDRVDYYGLDLTDFAVRAQKRRVSMANGRVGIILSYSTKGIPTEVEVTWNVFNRVIKSVDSVIFAEDVVEKHQFSTFLPNNTYLWKAPDSTPLPPLTGVAATMDLERLKPKRVSVPMLSVGILGLGSLVLLIRPLMGISRKAAMGVVVATFVGAAATVPFFQQEFVHPFAEEPRFEVNEQQAGGIFDQLHKNMFRAFDYRESSEVYDALAYSVDGPLLRDLYLQINRGLKVAEQGGAKARIKEVKLISGEMVDDSSLLPSEAAFSYRCRWHLIGNIEHWGHIHERTNEYEAQFKLKLIDGDWKITRMQMLDEKQGQVKTGLRNF